VKGDKNGAYLNGQGATISTQGKRGKGGEIGNDCAPKRKRRKKERNNERDARDSAQMLRDEIDLTKEQGKRRRDRDTLRGGKGRINREKMGAKK